LSVSRIECKASVRGKGEFTLSLYRHLAPLTVNAFLEALPLRGRVTVYPKAMVCVLTTIKTGVEKARLEFTKGETAFLAANGSVCIFTSNVKSQRPLNPLGKVEGNAELLDQLSMGDVVELILVQETGAQTQ
jgi:uncharacterized protein